MASVLDHPLQNSNFSSLPPTISHQPNGLSHKNEKPRQKNKIPSQKEEWKQKKKSKLFKIEQRAPRKFDSPTCAEQFPCMIEQKQKPLKVEILFHRANEIHDKRQEDLQANVRSDNCPRIHVETLAKKFEILFSHPIFLSPPRKILFRTQPLFSLSFSVSFLIAKTL